MGKVFKVIAYHKAGSSDIKRAIDRQAFEIGRNKGRPDNLKLWLGDGIYFWAKYSDAQRWKGKGYLYDNAIAQAELNCDRDFFLDLDDPGELAGFEKMFSDFMEKVLSKGEKDFHFAHDNIVDSFSCNIFKHSVPTKLIRYSFPLCSGRPQYCASDNSVVSDIKIAKETVC